MTKTFGLGLVGVKKVLSAESASLAAFKAKWTRSGPDGDIVAPAAGPKVLVPEYEVLEGGTRRRVSAHWRAADVWDAMEQALRQAHQRKAGDAAFAPPFTPGQIDTARLYRHLTENHAAGGMRCAALDAGRSGGGGGSFIDSFIDEGDRLAWMHGRIGEGVAMAVRRVRPSARGPGRAGIITDRVLVDAVCLGQHDLSTVLRRAGWATFGGHRKALRMALCAALDRMQGYGAV